MMQQRALIRGWSWLVGVAVASFGLNYLWEMMQMPAFITGAGQPFPDGIAFAAKHCFLPTLGDVLVACGTLAVGWIVYRQVDWIHRLSTRDVLIISFALVLIAFLVEVANVHILRRWGYGPLMPVVPILGVGALPLIQLALLTLVSFWIVGAVLGWKAREKAQ